jgi:hypothetical protein
MMVPVRFSYSCGQRKPSGTIICVRPSVFGNPFRVAAFGRSEAVALHRAWLDGKPIAADVLMRARLSAEALAARRTTVLLRIPELRDRDLGCF